MSSEHAGRSKRKKMSIERVKKYFGKYGMEERIREFDVSSAIELTIPELEKYSGYREWVDVCKLPVEG